MFASDKKVAEISDLIFDLKRYVTLQLKYLRLDFVGKFAQLLSALILGAILFILAAMVLVFFSIAWALMLAPYVGGMLGACSIVALFYGALALFVYWRRNALLVTPLANFLGRLFLEEDNEEKEVQP